MLRSEFRHRIPAGVEQHKHRPDMMPRRDGKKRIDSLLKSFRILLPTKIVQKDRMVFMPIISAHPSSRSIVASSKLSACHISNSLIAVDGRKFAPTGHGCCVPGLARVSVQRASRCRGLLRVQCRQGRDQRRQHNGCPPAPDKDKADKKTQGTGFPVRVVHFYLWIVQQAF